jgi:hypothetical protein
VKFKLGVSLFGASPVIIGIFPTIDAVWQRIVMQGATITSVVDGVHGDKSKHPRGFAVDVRTRFDYTSTQWGGDTKEKLAEELRKDLPNGYDVVVEKTHIHIEYDPE